MNAHDYAARVAEIDDQNRRMTGLVVAVVIGFFTALLGGLIWIGAK
jgi:hypothetical protein